MSSREIEYLHNLTFSSSGTADQDEDGLHMHGSLRVSHDYIPINPSGKTYYYDIEYSNDDGNYFCIGWERYDIDRTPRSNNACTYVVASKAAHDHVRIQGTANLTTDTVNPTAFIKLCILNNWSGSTADTGGKATIHYLSLREIASNDTFGKQSITKTGLMTSDIFRESDLGALISENGFIDSKSFIEF